MEKTYEVWESGKAETEHTDKPVLTKFFVAHKQYKQTKSAGLIVAIFPISDRHLEAEQHRRAWELATKLNEEIVAAEAYSKLAT